MVAIAISGRTAATAGASRATFRSRTVRPVLARRLPVANVQLTDNATKGKSDLFQGLSPVALASFTALLPLASSPAAFADEAEAAAAAASGAGGFGTGEAALLLTPVLIYALFNVYRDRFNPQAKFLDYIYILATVAIFGNLVSILVFKTRFF